MSESPIDRAGEEPYPPADLAGHSSAGDRRAPPPIGDDPNGAATCGDDEEPDDGCELNDWLRDNWDTMHALARAGQLPDLEPPRFTAKAEPDADAADDDDDPFAFDPVPLRPRLDGWTPERQVAFIECLAESGCVAEACRTVKMSQQSAYALRARPEALSFRGAWDAALDYAIRRLGDAALSRALNGVAKPVFFQGEQIGERRDYDERLTMFLLKRRDPLRYGDWRDKAEWSGHQESAALELLQAKSEVREDGGLDIDGLAERLGQRLQTIAKTVLGQAQLQRQRKG
jgi:hypothetical protein